MMVFGEANSKVLGSLEGINHNPELYIYYVLVCQSSYSLTKQSWSFGCMKRFHNEKICMGNSQSCPGYIFLGVTEAWGKKEPWVTVKISRTIIFESFRQICMKSENLHLPALPAFPTKPTPGSHSYQWLITNPWNAANSDRDVSCQSKVLFGETSEAGEYWGLRIKVALQVEHLEGEDCLNIFGGWGLTVSISYTALGWYFLSFILHHRRTAKRKGEVLAPENFLLWARYLEKEGSTCSLLFWVWNIPHWLLCLSPWSPAGGLDLGTLCGDSLRKWVMGGGGVAGLEA